MLQPQLGAHEHDLTGHALAAAWPSDSAHLEILQQACCKLPQTCRCFGCRQPALRLEHHGCLGDLAQQGLRSCKGNCFSNIRMLLKSRVNLHAKCLFGSQLVQLHTHANGKGCSCRMASVQHPNAGAPKAIEQLMYCFHQCADRHTQAYEHRKVKTQEVAVDTRHICLQSESHVHTDMAIQVRMMWPNSWHTRQR